MSNKKGIKIEDILTLYKSGMPPAQIAEIFNCCIGNITIRLKRVGINFKRDYSTTRRTRINKHLVDENYFDEINTEDKAYFLGLMYSDGSVRKDQFYLKLKDEHILHDFKKYIKSSAPIRSQNTPYGMAYIFCVCSQKLCKALINQGCYINKTKIIKFPQLDSNLIRHFIRGFFDGDGCLQLNNKLSKCRFDLTSASKEFLEQVRPIIAEKAISNGGLNKESKYNVWHLSFSGKQVIQILDWLYADANFYLNRKYFKYQILSSL